MKEFEIIELSLNNWYSIVFIVGFIIGFYQNKNKKKP